MTRRRSAISSAGRRDPDHHERPARDASDAAADRQREDQQGQHASVTTMIDVHAGEAQILAVHAQCATR
jgi:hypothetical protein